MAGEGQWRQRVRTEPANLLHFVADSRVAGDQPSPVWKKHDPLIVHPDVLHREQVQRLDANQHLFHAFADERGFWMLIPVDVAARHAPQSATRLDIAEDEENPSALLDQCRHHNFGVAEENPIALRADAQLLLRHQPGLRLRPAAGAERVHRLRLSRHPAGSTSAAAASLIASPIKNG
jgi:hypothetical protein